jgi:hypothetical protein
MLMLTLGMIAVGLIAADLEAQNYQVSQNGKGVGTAFLALKNANNGFSSTSGAKIDMPGLKYNFSETALLDGNYQITKVDLNGATNGTSATVDTSQRLQPAHQFLMKITANGKVIDTPLVFHPQSVLLPDFDPAGLQVLLNLGAAHNNRDIWALIPKYAGSITPLRIATNADMQGTLNGKPVTVHHLTVTYDSAKTELFSSPTNELLQAEWTDEGFAMVRNGFKLTPPAHPGAPPPPAPAAIAPEATPPAPAAQPQ